MLQLRRRVVAYVVWVLWKRARISKEHDSQVDKLIPFKLNVHVGVVIVSGSVSQVGILRPLAVPEASAAALRPHASPGGDAVNSVGSEMPRTRLQMHMAPINAAVFLIQIAARNQPFADSRMYGSATS